MYIISALLKFPLSLLLFVAVLSCNKNDTSDNKSFQFAKGADISWLTEMEFYGKKFYKTSGEQADLIELLKYYGMNTIRLRVWVNPANGWNNENDVLAKALRAKAAGMRIMIDFHYSDTWADPGKQTKPVAWQSANFNELNNLIKTHTLAVLNKLKQNTITPEWVQVGNETNDGMLWEDGRASVNMSNFATLINTGYDAVKQVFPDAKVIVHLSNGWDNSLYRWMFDGLKLNNTKYDVIGMSLYPSPANWQTYTTQCFQNMNDMISRYNKGVMIVEVGMSWDEVAASKAFLTHIIAKTKSLPDNKGLGVLYWEPQAYNWQGYTLGCFDINGKPTDALNAFR